VLKENDDRYPGDQRPLLLWHCDQDGEYMLRARCFRDKSGGQFSVRMQTYDSYDLPAGQSVDLTMNGPTRFLLRMQLKAGEIRAVAAGAVLSGHHVWVGLGSIVSPIGLPGADLISPLSDVFEDAVMAPVDGDYYVMAEINYGNDTVVHAWSKSYRSKELQNGAAGLQATAYGSTPEVFQFHVKKGDLLRVELGSSSPNSKIAYSEMPDVTEFSIAQPVADGKRNPFFPREPKPDEIPETAAVRPLLGRARDGRVEAFVAARDATVWLAVEGSGPSDAPYSVKVFDPVSQLTTGQPKSGTLKIGNADYWTFDAKAGDVMTLSANTSGFAGLMRVYDPELSTVAWHNAAPDELAFSWNLIARTPGHYLVQMTSIGGGGSGTYSLERNQYSAKTITRKSPARGDFSSGRAEVWQFTAEPNRPLYIHWKSAGFDYSVSVIDEAGNNLDLSLTDVGPNDRFGILTVDKPTTYVVVLTSGRKVPYTITLSDLPGYKPGGATTGG
ncbi:MAG TPA: hypothetical protein VNI20_13885, partial [Fimbriimonadaceae bacterium]|nr:hypothetical protein [Fimbriimonadaceae bacterium]